MTLYGVLMSEDIDNSVRDVLIRLNSAGYDTRFSCSGSPRDHHESQWNKDRDLSVRSNYIASCKNATRCYLVLMTSDKKRSSYIRDLREKLYGTNWYVQSTFNTHWKWLADRKYWYYLKHYLDYKDRITLEYICEFSDNACWRAWKILLEKLL